MREATRSRCRPMPSGSRRISPRRRASWSVPASPASARRCASRGAKAKMSEFAYLVLDRAGRERRGSLRAETPDEAREKLSARGLFVVKMESASGEAAPALLSRQLFVRKKLNPRQLTVFTRQLSTLAQVSPLEEALRTIARQTEK